MPFQSGTCSSSIGPFAGEVEVGLKWLGARDSVGHADVFVGHTDVLLHFLVEFPWQFFVGGYVLAVAGGPLSHRWTQQQFSALGSFLAVVGGPLSPR